ncbi:MAG: RNA-binding S4 domain-containing protein [Ruminococcaceae bacterium]|nr:RNA-binding S4 domain-containing protein [Oscillospiraceae bacterium]
MRLDKFLKVSRLIKRRTVANEACDSERISVNGRNAKASYDVKLGDVITVMFGSKSVTVRVLEIKDTTKKSESSGMYEIISETDA